MRTVDRPAERLLGLLGLGVRSGGVVIGVESVRSALQADRVACLVVAVDASDRAREKTLRLAQARQVPVVTGPSAGEMGHRLGRPPVMVAAVTERALARGMLDLAPVAEPDGGVSGQDTST